MDSTHSKLLTVTSLRALLSFYAFHNTNQGLHWVTSCHDKQLSGGRKLSEQPVPVILSSRFLLTMTHDDQAATLKMWDHQKFSQRCNV